MKVIEIDKQVLINMISIPVFLDYIPGMHNVKYTKHVLDTVT